MTQLAWRDVTAPDFATAMQGLRLAGDQFDKAGSGLSDVAGSINTIQNTNAARQFDLNLAKYTDPAALQAAQADGSIYHGVNLNHLSPDQVSSTVGRVTSLLSNQGDMIKNKDNQSLLDLNTNLRGIAGTDATTAVTARPHQFALMQIATDPKYANDPTGGQAAVQKYLKDNPEAAATLAKLPDAANYENFTNLSNLARNGLSNIGAAQGNTSQGLGIQDTVDNRKAEEIAGLVRPLGNGIRDWSQILDDGKTLQGKGYTQNQIERARRILVGDPSMRGDYVAADGSGGAGGGGGSMGGGGVPGGGDPSRVMNYEARGAGVAAIPDTVQNLGQWSDWASSLNQKGIKSSAGGLYQIVGDTLRQYAPKVLGADWRNQAFTPQAQDKIAEAIYNDNKGSAEALHNQWTSLTPDVAKSLVGKSWAEARPIIAQGESGASANMLAGILQNRESLVGVTTNLGQNTTGSPAQRTARLLADAAGDDSSPMTVAHKLTGKDGDFDGAPTKYVSQAIDDLVQESHGRISPAQAGLILQQSAHGEKGFFHRWASKLLPGGDGIDNYIDHSRASELIKLASDPNALNAAAIANDTNKTTSGMAVQGNQMLQDAIMARNVAARNAALSGRRFNSAPYDLQIKIAQGYAQGGMGLAQGAAAYGNPPQNGGATAPPTPRSVRAPSAHVTAGNIPQGALNAQAYLSRLVSQSVPGYAGPTQATGIKEQLAREWGVPSVDAALKNPMVAWRIAKMLDAKTAANTPHVSTDNFRR